MQLDEHRDYLALSLHSICAERLCTRQQCHATVCTSMTCQRTHQRQHNIICNCEVNWKIGLVIVSFLSPGVLMSGGLAKLKAAAASAAAAKTGPASTTPAPANHYVLRVTGHKDPTMLSIVKSGQAKQLKEACGRAGSPSRFGEASSNNTSASNVASAAPALITLPRSRYSCSVCNSDRLSRMSKSSEDCGFTSRRWMESRAAI